MDIRVAIFEDNKLVRDAFEAILNGTEGFRCTGVFSSCNDLAFDMQRSKPDVVLMDIEMQGMNGIEATKEIIKQTPHVKVLIQTVFEDDNKIFSALCAGAHGYILKHTPPAKLVEAITEVHHGGAPMSPVIASKVIQLFQQFAPRATSDAETEEMHLSVREKEILSYMMEGENLRGISTRMKISYETVRTHVKNIYKKMHVASSEQAIAKGYKQKLL